MNCYVPLCVHAHVGGVPMSGGDNLQGSTEERFEMLDRKGLRCDANNQSCYRVASGQYDFREVLDEDGKVGPAEEHQLCDRHVRQYMNNPDKWEFVRIAVKFPLDSRGRIHNPDHKNPWQLAKEKAARDAADAAGNVEATA